jgi:hypothetical protein
VAAALAYGISRSCFYGWTSEGREERARRERGERPRSSLDLQVRLVTELERAQASLEVGLVVDLRAAVKGKPYAILRSLDRLARGWDNQSEGDGDSRGGRLDNMFNEIWERAQMLRRTGQHEGEERR